MEFRDLAEARWTCRSYTDQPVEQNRLDVILECALLAPTAKNQQPWRIWVVQGEEQMEKMRQVTPCTYGAPLVLILARSTDEAFTREDGRNFGEIDAAIVGTHILFGAQDMGLGSTWIGAYDAAKLHELFPQVDGYEDVALFAIGHASPDAAPAPLHLERRPLDELVSYIQ